MMDVTDEIIKHSVKVALEEAGLELPEDLDLHDPLAVKEYIESEGYGLTNIKTGKEPIEFTLAVIEVATEKVLCVTDNKIIVRVTEKGIESGIEIKVVADEFVEEINKEWEEKKNENV